MTKRKKFFYGIGWLAACVAMLALMGVVAMMLWNWLVPDIFNGVEINFLQAVGLIALGKLLTGFFGWGRYGWRGGHAHHMHGGHWKKRWEEKMSSMTPEEREKFKQFYYDRCGWKKGWLKEDEKGNDSVKE